MKDYEQSTQSTEIAAYLRINSVGKALEYQTKMGGLKPRAVSPLQTSQTYGEVLRYSEQRLNELRKVYKEKVPEKDAVHYDVWQSIQSIAKVYTGNAPTTYEEATEALKAIEKDLKTQDALSLKVGKQVGFLIEREEDCVGF
ncbi:hypothetical protein J4457_01900 [Candidatus Woesearchaeota archaeon]|nr:hypothetical protein [Candidatus Woesearchaeota archaeon]